MIEEERLSPEDKHELERFRRMVKRGNAPLIDRDPTWLREMKLYEVNLYDPYVQTTIVNSFQFRDKDAAELAIQHAKKLCGEV